MNSIKRKTNSSEFPPPPLETNLVYLSPVCRNRRGIKKAGLSFIEKDAEEGDYEPVIHIFFFEKCVFSKKKEDSCQTRRIYRFFFFFKKKFKLQTV